MNNVLLLNLARRRKLIRKVQAKIQKELLWLNIWTKYKIGKGNLKKINSFDLGSYQDVI